MKKIGLLSALIITFVFSYGQQRTIHGTVTSAMDGKPMKGVKIILVEEKIDTKRSDIVFVKTKVQTKTNEKGEYKLTVPDTWKNVIRFQKNPFTTIDVKLNDRTELNLLMTLPLRQN